MENENYGSDGSTLSYADNETFANAPTQKKIGFFSAILIVIGSSIGAGIFFKSKAVLDLSHGSLVLAIFTWVVAGIAVMAMALALIEIASARNDNLGLIGWCKAFNSRIIYKASKNLMFYIYLPLTYFFMPLYALLSLQDAIGAFGTTLAADGTINYGNPNLGAGSSDWIIWTVISLCISAFFIFGSGLSSKFGNVANIIITSLKFIPLGIAAVIGFVFLGMNPGAVDAINPLPPPVPVPDPTLPVVPASLASFSGLTPAFGMIIAIGAIFFAYDGFYVTSGMQSEMKEPKKTPLAILFGLGIMTAIYLLIAVSMSMNGSGSFFGFGDWLYSINMAWFFGLTNLLIAVGILGVLNGFSIWAPRFAEDLIAEKELPGWSKNIDKLNSDKPLVGIKYSVIISLPIVLLFTIIGAIGYVDSGAYTTAGYTSEMVKLYSFADLMATWTAVFVFGFISLSILGGIKNRKTQLVVTDEKKYFMSTGWIAVIVNFLTLFLTAFAPFYDLFMLIPASNTMIELDGVQVLFEISSEILISRIMLVLVFFLMVGLMFLPTIFSDKKLIKQYGSIENATQALGLDQK